MGSEQIQAALYKGSILIQKDGMFYELDTENMKLIEEHLNPEVQTMKNAFKN